MTHQDIPLSADASLPVKVAHFDSGMMARTGLVLFVFSALAIFTILVLTAGKAAAAEHKVDQYWQHGNYSIKLSIDNDQGDESDILRRVLTDNNQYSLKEIDLSDNLVKNWEKLARLEERGYDSKTFSGRHHATPRLWKQPVSVDIALRNNHTDIAIHKLSPIPQITLPDSAGVSADSLPGFAAPVTAIPEPSTYLMLVAGFAVCMFTARRRLTNQL